VSARSERDQRVASSGGAPAAAAGECDC